MTLLAVNQLIETTDGDHVERILWVHPEGGGYYVIDVRAQTALPVFRNAADVVDGLEQGALRIAKADPWLAPLSDAGISANQKEKRDKLWGLVRPLVFDQPAIFMAEPRGKAIQHLVVERKSTKQTLYRLLRRYWQRGMIPNALLPDYDRSGARGKTREPGDKKRGRPRIGETEGINVDANMRSLFRAIVTSHFVSNQQLDFRGAYDEMITQHFSDRVIDEKTGRQVLVERKAIPTLHQFRYWFERDNDVFRVDRIRRTPRVYDKGLRALLDTSTSEVIGPASRYQIDATIADVYLVSRLRRTQIVGRPVLYIVVDVFSRMIVGVYVGLEGPSWVGAMMALANTAMDKVAYCRQFGIEIEDHDWPCRSLPDVLLGDRGEIAGRAIETLSSNFSVQVENAAPYRADWKGIVEQRFRLLPTKFKAYVPGYIAEDFQARGGRDYRLDATLDIDQFTRIIIHCILYYNNHHLFDDYDKSSAMIAEGVPAIPADLWEWGVVRRSGKLRVFPEDLVKMSLLPADDGKVTERGILFQGCYYTCQEAVTRHWFEKARQQGSWKVRLSFDPRNMDEVYLHEEAGRIRFIPCGLTNRSRAFQGRTIWEIGQILAEERQSSERQQTRILRGRINLTETIKDIVGEAVAQRPEPVGSDRERVGSIRANRRQERRENQTREAFQIGEKAALVDDGGTVVPFDPKTPPVAENYRLPSIAAIRRHLEEGKDDDDEC